ncbi:MAG: apolipoprotein N-acyltransferase [Actinobacteria bacterium]|nr:apolipoprotein N-acyltransferase [Actinomycetota bacterium]
MLPREAPEPARGQDPRALPRLRLSPEDLRLPVAALVAAASAVLLFLANPPVGMWPLAFVALTPFLWLVRASRPRRGFLLGLVFGVVYFGALLYWILLFGELAWSAVTLGFAPYWGLFGLVAPVLWRGWRPVRSSIGLAALWTGVEYLRTLFPLGGFAWGLAGTTQAGNPLLLPLASVTGVWGMSFVVVLVNALVLLVLHRVGRRNLAALGLVALAAVLVVAPAAIPIPAPGGRTLTVASIQVNVPRHLRADPDLEDRVVAEQFAAAHRSLIHLGERPPDLVVWPENSLDQDPIRDPSLRALVTDAVRSVGAPTLVGAITRRDDGRAFNEALLYGGAGELVDRYAKQHLVPYGEFVPFRRYLDWISALDQIPSDLSAGTQGAPLQVGDVRFAAVVCFENIFPSLDRRLVNRGAEFLVVITNNASYERTAASEQHLAFSRIRAVENARWVVHAAVSGISATIDHRGRVIQRAELFEPEILVAGVAASSARTVYGALGDWFAWLSLLGAMVLLLLPRRRDTATTPLAPLPDDPRTLVILPTYNEATTVEEVIRRLRAVEPGVDVLVVDDGSPDGTGSIVRRLAEEPRPPAPGDAPGDGPPDRTPVRLVERPRKAGLASAYLFGFELALEEGYDLIVEMDSDLSHQPEELGALLEGARSSDLTIGSRYVPGGSVTNWGWVRRLLSRWGNSYARMALGFPVTDATSGFRVYRRGLLAHLMERGVHSEGYAFQVELAYRAWWSGHAVGEVPITFREREHGHSKISRRIVVEALWLIGVWGLRDRLRVPRPGPQPRGTEAMPAPSP